MDQTGGLGPASLTTACERVITRHRDWLGDVAHVPLGLLEACLHACSARQLARIEDETRQGGVDISVDLAPHWKRCYELRFGDLDPEHQGIPILEGACEPSSGRDPMTDWRALYEWREEEYEAKLKASGERLKQMTHAASTARDVKSIQVLGTLPKGPLARSSFSRVGAGPVQHASTRNRLMRKLGMGRSKPGPARSANAVRRVNGSVVSPHARHAAGSSSGSGQREHSSPGLRLTECEIDLTPSMTPSFYRASGGAQRAAAAADAGAASSSSQALVMTDNRLSSQPAFETRLRAAPEKEKAPPAGSEQSRTPLLGTPLLGTPLLGSEPRRAASQQQQAGQSTSRAPQVHATKLVGSQASNGGTTGLALSTAKKQVSPQPKPRSLPRTKAHDAPCKGARDEPAKRVKYDHLLGGNALLSLAGRGRHSRR